MSEPALTPGSSVVRLAASLAAALVVLGGPGAARAAVAVKADPPAQKELLEVFKPDRTDRVAISPDGVHLAYTIREGQSTNLGIVDLNRPTDKPVFLSTGPLLYLQWATADTLLFGTRLSVRAVGPDGLKPRVVADGTLVPLAGPADPDFPSFPAEEDAPTEDEIAAADAEAYELGEASRLPIRILGLVPGERDSLLVQVDVTGDGPANTNLYKVSITTGKVRLLAFELGSEPFMADQQGRPRLTQRIFLGNISYQYKAPTRFAGWWDIDRYLAPALAMKFRYGPRGYYTERTLPLAFDRDPNILYVASNIGHDTYGIFGLDFAAKKLTDFNVSVPAEDLAARADAFTPGPLIFDRDGSLVGIRRRGAGATAVWLDPRMAGIQAALDRALPDRRVEVVDWDASVARVVAFASTPSDPGRIVWFEPARPNVVTEVLRRAPSLAGTKANPAERFFFTTAGGARLTGLLTLPKKPTTKPPALVVYCRDVPGDGPVLGSDRNVQALAAMGFAVAQVDYHGSAGYGLAYLKSPNPAFDRIPLEDIRDAIGALAASRKVDTRRVGLVGEGFGGFIAVRGLELYPEEFQCAVTINSPSDPAAWLKEAKIVQRPGGLVVVEDAGINRRRAFFAQAEFSGLSARDGAAKLKRPVFILQDTSKDSADLWKTQGLGLRDAIKRARGDVEYLAVGEEFSAGDPQARSQAFSEIAGFLTTAMYEFSVEIGPTRVAPQSAPLPNGK